MDRGFPHFPDAPQSEFEKTVSELITRAERALSVQDRLRALIGANRAVTENLDLDRVLVRIVEAAVTLVDADSGALGIIDEAGTLERFIHVGIPPAEAAEIGFPERLPPMDAFLNVPIRVRDEVFGNLSLAHRRGEPFTAEDEELIESLAATAGIAIENASLYDEARRQQRLSAAMSEITAALLSPGGGEALGVVAERVAQVIPIELVVIVVPDDADQFRVEVAHGSGASELSGMAFAMAGSLASLAMATGRIITDSAIERSLLDERIGRGPTAAVPLIASGGHPIGALYVCRGPGSDAFTHAELATVSEFAAQAGIAVSLAWARRDRQRLDVIEDRGRIARDLHDHVIQRLFALGLGLQEFAAVEPAQADRVERYVADLDAAIADIRTAIFTLRGNPSAGRSLARHRLLDVLTDLAPTLTSTPRITFTGPVDLVLTGGLADDVIAVVRETLANVARHAQAESSVIAVTVTDAEVTVTVDDDGVGLDPGRRRASGVANLTDRATQRGGTFTLEARPDRGTRARWNVPLPA